MLERVSTARLVLTGKPSKITAGVSLDVVASIGGDGQSILMALHPVVNQNVSYVSLDGQTVEEVDKTDDNRMQIFLPKWRTQELSTRVVVGTGQSIMMGGVLEREQRTVVESVPILGNIPGLGSPFRKRATLDKPRYLLIFVTATLIDEDGSFITYEKPEEGPVAPVRAPSALGAGGATAFPPKPEAKPAEPAPKPAAPATKPTSSPSPAQSLGAWPSGIGLDFLQPSATMAWPENGQCNPKQILCPRSSALISVSDKTDLVPFAEVLSRAGVEILSTGGTAKVLREAGIEVMDLSDYTGFPEMLDGRVKTLHPMVHGGLLYLRENDEHVATTKEHGIKPIDLVVVNLYPFEQTVANPNVTLEDAIENIDIGGPSMLRSAAKNHQSVTVVVDPADYGRVADQVSSGGDTTLELRRELAVKVYSRTSAYDGAIALHLANVYAAEQPETDLPDKLVVRADKTQDLRYGENPTSALRSTAGSGIFTSSFMARHCRTTIFSTSRPPLT